MSSTYTHGAAPRRMLWSSATLLLLLFLGSISPGHSLAEMPHSSHPDAAVAGAPSWSGTGTVQPYDPTPAAWEQRSGEGFVNRGVAEIARIATRFVLEISCEGIHSIYIHESHGIDLAEYVGKVVRAQYRYAKVSRSDKRCIRAPCGPYEEVGLVIERLTVLTLTEEEQAHSITGCPEIP